MFPNLKCDIRRYKNIRGGGLGFKDSLYLIFEQGVWAIVAYRFGRWVHSLRIPIVRMILKVIAFILFKITEILTGISLPASAQIGKGLYIGHFGGIIVHSLSKIGKNCSIGSGVVIGTRGLGNKGVPIIGDNVYIGVGAKVLGGIKIGNNVRIGANAVVLKDIPDNSTVVGIPAKIIKINNLKLKEVYKDVCIS